MLKKLNVTNFSVKFIDIMIGIILGLGFQWWANLREPWQYLAFVFVYLDVVDFWIDYGPALKKFPPKREIDVFLDLAICFSLFLYIYSTQLTVFYFLLAFALMKFFDFCWLLSSQHEYRPSGFDKIYVETWMLMNGIEILLAVLLTLLASATSLPALFVVLLFIAFRVITRIAATFKYKRLYLSN